MSPCHQVRRGGAGLLLIIGAASCRPLTSAEGTAAIQSTGDSRGVSSESAAPTAEWIRSARTEVIYLRWSAPGGTVAGVIQTARREAGGKSVHVSSGIVAGATNGPHVVLRAQGQTWSGTIQGESLVLSVTRADGARDDLRFVPGTVTEFDAAVTALRRALPTSTTALSPRRAAAATSTTTTVATTPSEPDPRAAALAELEGATDELGDARASSAGLGRLDRRVDRMYRVADAVYAALARPRCGVARAALRRLGNVVVEVERAVATVDESAARIEAQRAVVLDVGMRVVALDDAGLNSVIVATNDELAAADAASSDLRRYAGEVRAAVTATRADADRAIASQC